MQPQLPIRPKKWAWMLRINNPLIDRLLDLGCCLIYLCLRIQIQLSLSRKRPSTADMISRPNEPLESASGAPQRSSGTQLVLSTFFLEIKHTVFLQFWTTKEQALSDLAFQTCKRFIGTHIEKSFWNLVSPFWEKGPPNPGFTSIRVEIWDFLKKDSQHFKNSFQFGFLWIPCKTGKQN